MGKERCEEIEVVAADQFDGYKLSVKENCPNAIFVWDRFHIMQTFQNYINSERQWLNEHMCKGEQKRLTRGKFKQLFTKNLIEEQKLRTGIFGKS